MKIITYHIFLQYVLNSFIKILFRISSLIRGFITLISFIFFSYKLSLIKNILHRIDDNLTEKFRNKSRILSLILLLIWTVVIIVNIMISIQTYKFTYFTIHSIFNKIITLGWFISVPLFLIHVCYGIRLRERYVFETFTSMD